MKHVPFLEFLGSNLGINVQKNLFNFFWMHENIRGENLILIGMQTVARILLTVEQKK
jgi:hypothetical protein